MEHTMTDLVCISPIDGHEVARRKIASLAEIDRHLADARHVQPTWAKLPLETRIAAVLRFLDALLAMNQEIIPELALQMGRPVRFGGEFGGVEERIRAMAALAPHALAPIIPKPDKQGFTRVIERQALGTVLVVAPWNYPFLTAVNSIAPALIAGNAVILKHSTQTILAGERIAKAMEVANLPKGLFANLHLSHAQTESILAERQVNHCNFTGSVEAGRRIERAAAGTFTTLGLELGGKDPAYVREDANLAYAIENIVDGAFFNSGQCCCGIERIYVHERHFDAFVEGAVALTNKYVLGNPLDKTTTLGPMATLKGAKLVRDQISEAVDKGAKTHIDIKHFAADTGAGTFVAPQILTNVDHSMALMRDENFGPVVGIMKVKDDAEAARLMNDSPYGLTASIWTQDEAAAHRIGREIETGTVFMNRCDYLDPGLAWTGVKDTGRGVSLSEIGYEMLTRPKSFHLKTII